MIFDKYGLPKENGASDFADSARLAGLMAVFDMPNTPDLYKYFINGNTVRHPYETKYPENEPRCMSRDQLICLSAGYKAQGLGLKWEYYDKWFAPNTMNEKTKKWKIPDLLFPQHNNHFRICAGFDPSDLGNKWLEKDLKIFTHKYQLAEPNQMICMLMSHPDKKYLKYWLNNNPLYEKAIRDYWHQGPGAWRGEKELADKMVETLRAVKNG